MTNLVSTSQIDQLGNRLRGGVVSGADIRLLDAYRRSFLAAYETVVGMIRNDLSLEPTGRPAKSTSSIVEKLRRESIRLSQMQDIAGCRLIVPDVLAQDHVVEQLQALLSGARVVDRRLVPRFGYRAVHVIAGPNAMSVEIQIRSALQHLWAEQSEKLSDVVDPAIKYGGGEPALHKTLNNVSEIVVKFEDGERLLAMFRQRQIERQIELSPIIARAEDRKRQLIASTPTEDSRSRLDEFTRSIDAAQGLLSQDGDRVLTSQRALDRLRRVVGDLLRRIGDEIPKAIGDQGALPDPI